MKEKELCCSRVQKTVLTISYYATTTVVVTTKYHLTTIILLLINELQCSKSVVR